MKRSSSHVYMHLVWATHGRDALIGPAIRSDLYACMAAKCQDLGCAVVAIGGTPDHVHLLTRLSCSVSCARLVHDVKGASSHLANHRLGLGSPFRWQRGYGAWSISPQDLPRIKDYIDNQDRHHAHNSLIANLEECAGDEELPG